MHTSHKYSRVFTKEIYALAFEGLIVAILGIHKREIIKEQSN